MENEKKYPDDFYNYTFDLSQVSFDKLVELISTVITTNKKLIPIILKRVLNAHSEETILIAELMDLFIKESTTVLNSSLSELIDDGNVELSVDNDGNFVYFTTDKGLKLINKIRTKL